MKLIDRYLLRELLTPFLLTIAALMMILLTEQMGRLVELFVSKGVSLVTAGKVFFYLLPAFLVIAIPMSVLIATIIAISRLTADSEVIALQASGIGMLRLSVPIHSFTLLSFFLTFGLSVWAQPWVGRSLKTAAFEVVRQELSLGLESGVFNEPFKDMMIYVDEMPSPGTLQGVMIYDFRDPGRPVLTLAREGSLLGDPASDWIGFRLLNGSQHRDDATGAHHQWITFRKYEFRLNLAAVLNRDSDQEAGPDKIEGLERRWRASEELESADLRILQEHYKTYAFPFSTLIFGALGIPLGLIIKRGGRMGGFAAGIAIALLYYVMMIIGDFLVGSVRLSPRIAAWLPNGVTGLLATVFWSGLYRSRWSRWALFHGR